MEWSEENSKSSIYEEESEDETPKVRPYGSPIPQVPGNESNSWVKSAKGCRN